MRNATTSIAKRAHKPCATSCLRSKHLPHYFRLKRSCFRYDPNSNRLSAIEATTSDTDLDGSFDADDFTQTSSQSTSIDPASNKLLGFTQTLTKVRGTRTLATTNANVSYQLDAAGNLTSDGLRSFEYDPANRLAKLKILKDGEASSISYLHNSLGQRVFKGEPVAEQTLPNQAVLGEDFITYLRRQFGWLFTAAQSNASIGTAFTYADGQLPEWALLGEYDNGSASGKGRTEYLWLPTEDGSAVPVGLYRNGKFFAVHADHLGTPRLITNEANQPVWQWPYSAFGNNKPTGVLKATPNPRAAITNQPVLLRATTPAAVVDLRFPGQHADDEAGVFYNYQRNYQAGQGRYTQADPIGLDGGLSRFAYVGGNPITRIDPTGRLAIVIPFIPAIITGADLAIGAGLGLLGYGLDRMFNEQTSPKDPTADVPVPPFPGINDLATDCVPGKRIVSIITTGRHKGQTNIEQEYQCSCGTVTRHTIVKPSGTVVHDHFRPGPAKGTIDD